MSCPIITRRGPKPCLNGWGQRYLTVNPIGDVLPCPTASSAIPDLRFENVRARSLDWIWRESESFNRFRGTEWMPEPCQSCPQKEIDFGGCRCQAALLTGNAANTDPVCTVVAKSRTLMRCCGNVNATDASAPEWTFRRIRGSETRPRACETTASRLREAWQWTAPAKRSVDGALGSKLRGQARATDCRASPVNVLPQSGVPPSPRLRA